MKNKELWFENRGILGQFVIAKIEKIHIEQLQAILGTNLVYRSNDKIIKIYAPDQYGFHSYWDYCHEVYALQRLALLDVKTPKLYSYGSIQIDQEYFYIIEEYINWPTAKEYFASHIDQKANYVELVIKALQNLSSLKKDQSMIKICKMEDVATVERRKRIWSSSQTNFCFLHGDLSDDNILFNGKEVALMISKIGHMAQRR